VVGVSTLSISRDADVGCIGVVGYLRFELCSAMHCSRPGNPIESQQIRKIRLGCQSHSYHQSPQSYSGDRNETHDEHK